MPERQRQRSARARWIVAGALLSLLVVAAVLGGVLGAGNATKSASLVAGAAATLPSTTTTFSSSPLVSSVPPAPATPSFAPPAPTSSPTASFVAQPLWDWNVNISIGVCLGNWLVLERWMNEDWFVGHAGEGAYDELGFSATLGPQRALEVLHEHWSTWITEEDVEIMFQSGINMIRIPLPFWAFIPTLPTEPYVALAGQAEQLLRVLSYLSKRGMYALLDLHALPGSQNGEESSGQNTTSPAWFGNVVNQARSDQLVLAVLDFIANSPWRGTIAGLEVINEPRPYTPAQNAELADYFARSYATIQRAAWPVPMFVHHGFIGSDPLGYWAPFVAARATSPASIVMEDHPYPGNFPPQSNVPDMLAQVCNNVVKYSTYPVPVAITEWSFYTGVRSDEFEKTFYERQLTAWAFSAGGMFWSYKVISSVAQTAQGLNYTGYSFLSLVQASLVPQISSSGGNTTASGNAATYLGSITGGCRDPGRTARNSTVWTGVQRRALAG